MTTKAVATKKRILESAKAEFMERGFSGASLRVIAKNAGVTTGALYGSFADKDALFDALVGEHIAYFYREFTTAQIAFQNLDDDKQVETMHTHSAHALFGLIGYVYDHFDAFSLALCHSTGSKYETWLEPIIAMEEESTKCFIATIRQGGYPVKDISDQLIHILCTGFFHDVMETVAHNMDRETAIRHIALLCDFTTAGWDRLLGIP